MYVLKMHIKKAWIKSEIRISGQVFLFRLFVNKIVLVKEDLYRIPLFSKLNEEEIRRCIDSSDELLLQSGQEFISEGKMLIIFMFYFQEVFK